MFLICPLSVVFCPFYVVTPMEERALDAYIAPGRAKHAAEGEGGGARIAAMREKIKAGGHATPYRLRKPLLLGPRDPRPRSQRAEQIRNRQAAQHRTHLRPTPARSSLTPRSIHWRTI